ncbi:hypothetical protein GJ496_007813 [Pomphorhynchus laevis]|nr:hypothetical protein GJ496_007813 [Pomphorhynchus laevis]
MPKDCRKAIYAISWLPEDIVTTPSLSRGSDNLSTCSFKTVENVNIDVAIVNSNGLLNIIRIERATLKIRARIKFDSKCNSIKVADIRDGKVALYNYNQDWLILDANQLTYQDSINMTVGNFDERKLNSSERNVLFNSRKDINEQRIKAAKHYVTALQNKWNTLNSALHNFSNPDLDKIQACIILMLSAIITRSYSIYDAFYDVDANRTAEDETGSDNVSTLNLFTKIRQQLGQYMAKSMTAKYNYRSTSEFLEDNYDLSSREIELNDLDRLLEVFIFKDQRFAYQFYKLHDNQEARISQIRKACEEHFSKTLNVCNQEDDGNYIRAQHNTFLIGTFDDERIMFNYGWNYISDWIQISQCLQN